MREDQTPKKVFVLGVYASTVHARWKKDGQIICQALAVASGPRIFWDGDPDEAKRIIDAVAIPPELGTLEPAGRQLNGPSAKVLDENILAPLGFTRADAWLCDCLPETRINPSQAKVIRERYDPLIEQYGLSLFSSLISSFFKICKNCTSFCIYIVKATNLRRSMEGGVVYEKMPALSSCGALLR